MPVPNYLLEIAYNESSASDLTTFELKCKCGCTEFFVYESYLDRAEKEQLKPWEAANDRLYSGGTATSCTKDENGVIHHWKHLTNRRDGPKEEVIIPPLPVCARIDVVRVRCADCGKEYVVFDSRYNGYSGRFGDVSSEEKEYVPHIRAKKRRDGQPVRISVCVEHDESFDEFQKATGIICGFEDYTDAFTWIVIYSIDSSNKKRKLFEFETD